MVGATARIRRLAEVLFLKYLWLAKWSDKWQRNVRVIRKSYLRVPKKNGKSLMEGAPILYGMYGEGVKGAQFYCLAADFDQAQNVANPLATVIENDNDLLDGTRVYRKEKKVTTISYAFFEDDFKYQNNLRVLSKREKVDGKILILLLPMKFTSGRTRRDMMV